MGCLEEEGLLLEWTGGYAASTSAGLEVHPAGPSDAVPGEARSVPARNELAIT